MKYLLVIVLLGIPTIACAKVQISEVAWMGTPESQYAEWIEFYNDGSSSVNLSGWKLYEQGGAQLVYTFSKTIPGQGYLLLERATASVPDAVPGVDDESGSFGGGGLANSGEYLVLKDTNGAVVQNLDFSAGWPAGSAETKQTMQFLDGDWITATGTPDAPPDSKTSDDSNVITTETAIEKKEDAPIPKVSPNKPSVSFTVPSVLFQNIPYTLIATPTLEYGYKITHGRFYWNLGDGSVVTQDNLLPVEHVYHYPGTYTISFLYTDPTGFNPPLMGSKKVTIKEPSLSIKRLGTNALSIINDSADPVDLSGWSVETQLGTALIPPLTIVASHATITIPNTTFSSVGAPVLSIKDPSGVVVARTNTARVLASQVKQDPLPTQADVVDLVTTAEAKQTTPDSPKQNHTKVIVFGAIALFVIALSILLERFMARQEY